MMQNEQPLAILLDNFVKKNTFQSSLSPVVDQWFMGVKLKNADLLILNFGSATRRLLRCHSLFIYRPLVKKWSNRFLKDGLLKQTKCHDFANFCCFCPHALLSSLRWCIGKNYLNSSFFSPEMYPNSHSMYQCGHLNLIADSKSP